MPAALTSAPSLQTTVAPNAQTLAALPQNASTPQVNSTNYAANLNNAIASNNKAYGGLEHQLQQQYYQNAANTQQNLINAGLGNTTVAQNMQQAPVQSYNSGLLNIVGQQQGQAANIYGQASQEVLNSDTNAANNASAQTRSQIAAAPSLAGISQASANNANQQLNGQIFGDDNLYSGGVYQNPYAMAGSLTPQAAAFNPYAITPATSYADSDYNSAPTGYTDNGGDDDY